MPITRFDSADVAIKKTINEMCTQLFETEPNHANFLPLVEAISKLRSSLNSPLDPK